MPRTDLTPQSPPGPYPGTIAADGADITFTAGDSVNNNAVVLTGDKKELVIVRNDNVAAQTISIISTPDSFKRTGDITDYSIGPSEYAVFGPFALEGWRQSDGKLYIDPQSADVKIAVIKLP